MFESAQAKTYQVTFFFDQNHFFEFLGSAIRNTKQNRPRNVSQKWSHGLSKFAFSSTYIKLKLHPEISDANNEYFSFFL